MEQETQTLPCHNIILPHTHNSENCLEFTENVVGKSYLSVIKDNAKVNMDAQWFSYAIG